MKTNITIKKVLKHRIKEKLKEVFSKCIGEENGISKYELYKEVFDISPNLEEDENTAIANAYRLSFIIRELRRERAYFIINNNDNFFIPCRIEEADIYAKILDNDIKYMKKAKEDCYEYVKNKKWKEIEK